MPSKKKKYNARFPAGRIKKIMQTDEEVGKVAQAVPIIISKALEMFIESLLKKSMQITQSRNAKTLTPSHMKQCILSECRFDFLKDLVKCIPDASVQEDNENNALAESNVDFGTIPDEPVPESKSTPIVNTNFPVPAANFYTEQSTSTASTISRTPVIQFSPRVTKQDNSKYNFSVNNIITESKNENKLHIKIDSQEIPATVSTHHIANQSEGREMVPPLVPISANIYGQSSTGDNLCIDEDYDN